MAINWSEDTFSAAHLSENVEFPQLIRIAAPSLGSGIDKGYVHGAVINGGCSSSADNAHISYGDVLKLHGVKKFKRVLATRVTDISAKELVAHEYGYLSAPGDTSICKQFSIPSNFSVPLQIVPYRDRDFVYHTVGDLVKETPRPKSVIVNKRIVLQEKNCTIKEGDIISILSIDKRCTNLGVVDFLICKHNDKTVGLPMSCVGEFTAHTEETLYLLSDIIRKEIDLPQKVIFIKKDSTPSISTTTLLRGGEHFIIPGQPYILQNVVKRQYLICTKYDQSYTGVTGCVHRGLSSSGHVIFIPTDSAFARKLLVHLPLFHDLREYRKIVTSHGCANFSVRNIIDCTPIELAFDSKVVAKELAVACDIQTPTLPPRKDISDQDGKADRQK